MTILIMMGCLAAMTSANMGLTRFGLGGIMTGSIMAEDGICLGGLNGIDCFCLGGGNDST